MLQSSLQKCQPPSGPSEGLLHRQGNGLVSCRHDTEENCFDTSLGSFLLKMLSVLMHYVPWGHLQQDVFNRAIKVAKMKWHTVLALFFFDMTVSIGVMLHLGERLSPALLLSILPAFSPSLLPSFCSSIHPCLHTIVPHPFIHPTIPPFFHKSFSFHSPIP